MKALLCDPIHKVAVFIPHFIFPQSPSPLISSYTQTVLSLMQFQCSYHSNLQKIPQPLMSIWLRVLHTHYTSRSQVHIISDCDCVCLCVCVYRWLCGCRYLRRVAWSQLWSKLQQSSLHGSSLPRHSSHSAALKAVQQTNHVAQQTIKLSLRWAALFLPQSA